MTTRYASRPQGGKALNVKFGGPAVSKLASRVLVRSIRMVGLGSSSTRYLVMVPDGIRVVRCCNPTGFPRDRRVLRDKTYCPSEASLKRITRLPTWL